MAGQNTLILASDYNSIQAKVALVLGSGSGLYGYGQSVLSGSLAANAKISVTQWTNLRTDLLKARQHQTGTDLSGSLAIATTSRKISEADRAAYDSMATDITTNYLAVPPISQATRENLVNSQSLASSWNGVKQQTVTVTFPDADSARYYFNTGGRFEFSSSLVGGTTNGGKTDTWRTILNAMGTINFNYNSTSGASGTGSAYGWNNVPNANTIIFEKGLVNGSTYFPNRYQIYANKTSSVQMVFTIQWRDDSGQPNAPWGTDENVDGTLNSYVQVYRASGDNVSVPLPPAVTTAIG